MKVYRWKTDQTSEATSQTIFSIRRDQIQDKNSFSEDVSDFWMEP